MAAGRVVEALPQGGRDAGLVAELLGKGLAALEPRRRLARAAAGDAGIGEGIGQAGDQRGFRTRHHEVDRLLAGEADQRGDVGGADRHVLGQCPGAGIAGRGVDLGRQRRGRDRPD